MTFAALRGHRADPVGVPTGLLASAAFNDSPLTLHIRGVHESHARLFDGLAKAGSQAEAGHTFQDYMDDTFGLRRPNANPGGVRRHRASYLRLLKGWGYDANSREGAVVKGWAESRFGLFPTLHRTPLAHFASPAWSGYAHRDIACEFGDTLLEAQVPTVKILFCKTCCRATRCRARRNTW